MPLKRRSIEARSAVIVESLGIQKILAHLIRGSKNFYFKVSTPIIVSVYWFREEIWCTFSAEVIPIKRK